MKKLQATVFSDLDPTSTENVVNGFSLGQWWYNTATGSKFYHKLDGVWVAISSSNITKTSDLINDGDNGTSHFISLEDLPSNLVLYPTSAVSDISGYSKIVTSITDASYNTTAVDISTGAISTTNQLIASLATSANIIIGNPGLFNVSTIGNIKRISGSGTAEFYFEVYKRTSSGTETLITTSSVTSEIITASYEQFSASALWNDGVFLSTDRIVLKFYGSKVGGGSNPTYNFQFGGSNPVRTTVPIPLNVAPTNLAVEGLSNMSDVSYTTPLDTDSLLIKENANSLWKRLTWSSLKSFFLLKSNNGSDIINIATFRQNLGVDKLTQNGNSNYTILLTDKAVVTSATFTTSRTWTLPLANSVNAGYEIIVADLFGAVSSTNTLVISRTGSDTINGSTSLTIGAQYGMRRLISDGVSKWTFDAGVMRISDFIGTTLTASKVVVTDVNGKLSNGIDSSFLDATSSIQTQLNNRSKIIINDSTDSSNVTGVVTEVIAKSYEIQPNSFTSTDFFKIYTSFVKDAVNGASSVRIKASNTNNFATSTIIAFLSNTTFGASTRRIGIRRQYHKFQSGNLVGFPFSTTSVNDEASTTASTSTSMVLDPTQTIYLWVTIQNASASDGTICNAVQITN